jgi:hypothetical protein
VDVVETPAAPIRYTSTFDASDAQRIAAEVGGWVAAPRFWRHTATEGDIYIYDVYVNP